MARHGFGRGEYKYFALSAARRSSPACARRSTRGSRPSPTAGTQRMGIDVRYPGGPRRLPRALPCGRAAPADAAAAAVRPRRLQLPAPGSLRRARLPAAGGDPAVRARARFHGRRIRAHRAAPAHAVARRGRAAAPGRRASSSPCTSARCRARAASTASIAARREPRALRDAGTRSASSFTTRPDERGLTPTSSTARHAPARAARRRRGPAARLRLTDGAARCSTAVAGRRGGALPPYGHARRLQHVGRDDQLRRARLGLGPLRLPLRRGRPRERAATGRTCRAVPRPRPARRRRAGFEGFAPDACLVNRYVPGAKLACTRTGTSAIRAPIVSVSLGAPGRVPVRRREEERAAAPRTARPRRRRRVGRAGAPALTTASCRSTRAAPARSARAAST